MESNPAFYQEPEDVRVEVGQVGSGPNQEHLTDQVILIFRIINNQCTFNLTNFLTKKIQDSTFDLKPVGTLYIFHRRYTLKYRQSNLSFYCLFKRCQSGFRNGFGLESCIDLLKK